MRVARWLKKLSMWLRLVLHRREVDQELDDEIACHVEARTEENIAKGMGPDEARRAARLELGGVEQVKERVRAARAGAWLETLLQDVRFGVRMLRRNPGFTTVAVVTLALGIGANTAIFSVVNAVLIRSLPYKNPGRLVYVWAPSHNLPQLPLEALGPSNGDFFDIQRQSRSFSAITLFDQRYFNLASEGPAERVSGVLIQPNFFSTFGIGPLLGRDIERADTKPGTEHVAIISYGLWQSAFGGSAQVLSKNMILDGQRYHVIGVMPAFFGYPSGNELPYSNPGKTQVWLPMVLTPQEKADRQAPSGTAIARLRPGVTIAQARAELNALMPQLDALHPARGPFKGVYGVLKPFSETVVGGVRLFVWLLFGAVSLVLLIACANAANLLLARAASRTHEMGIRAALGAGRRRLIRQVLTEALLLACAGGAVGIFIAYAAIRLLLRLNPGNIPRLNDTSLDARVLFFSLAISIFTGVIFGIVPAIDASRTDLVELLKRGGRKGITAASRRLRHSLIVGEVALAVMLLIGSGLLIHSYINLQSVSTGFSDSTLTMHIALDSRYSHAEQRLAFFRKVLDKVGALHGVNSIGAVNALPLSHIEEVSEFSVEGYANKRGQLVDSRLATENYFNAMGTPLIAGRFFTSQDSARGTSNVLIVNKAFAKAYLEGRAAIGAHICLCRFNRGAPTWSTVVGVVGNTRFSNLENMPPPQVYQPFWQNTRASQGAYIAIRTSSPPAQMIPAIRSVVTSIDPTLAVADIQTMDQRVSEADSLRRFQTSLFGIFSGVALFLAATGLYGVMTYSVRQRTNEIGIRVALGAQPASVLKLIITQGMVLTIVGLFIGVVASLALSRMLSSLLYGVARTDPTTFIVVGIVLISVSLLSCYVSARRAARVDPMVALRYE